MALLTRPVVYEQLCSGATTQSRVSAAAIVGLVCGPLCLLAIALRFYSRCAIARCIGLDDWIMIAAVPPLTALIVVEVIGVLLQLPCSTCQAY